MAGQNQGGPNLDQFEAYFRRADTDHDGRISGAEAVAFFQGSNLSKPVLAQVLFVSTRVVLCLFIYFFFNLIARHFYRSSICY